MADSAQKAEKLALDGIDPEQPFFVAMSVCKIDGSLDEENPEGLEGLFATEIEAVEKLKELAEEYVANIGYVYRCTPVKCVSRGPVRVTAVKAR